MNTRSFLTRVAAITGVAVGAFAFVAIAGTWTPPAGAPPTNNVPAPINVGPNTDSSGNALTQVKSDAFVVQGLLGLSSLQFNPGGQSNVKPGSVLTASDNKGDAQWSSSFPPPAYDSGWVTIPTTTKYPYAPGGWGMFPLVLNHNLGSTNTLVYLEWQDQTTGGIGTTGLFNGGEEFSGGSDRGFSWINKTSNSITLVRSKDEDPVNKVRVLIWKIGTP